MGAEGDEMLCESQVVMCVAATCAAADVPCLLNSQCTTNVRDTKNYAPISRHLKMESCLVRLC